MVTSVGATIPNIGVHEAHAYVDVVAAREEQLGDITKRRARSSGHAVRLEVLTTVNGHGLAGYPVGSG